MNRNKAYYQNRINILTARKKDNYNIIRKLKRKLNSFNA